MKKVFKLICAAALMFAASSCVKDDLTTPEGSFLAEKTYSATIQIPTKADIGQDGSMLFTAGDYILIFNNNPVANTQVRKTLFSDVEGKTVVVDPKNSASIIAESIVLTADMISDGGKSVTFSTVVSDPATPRDRANCYHFLYLSPAAYADWNYSELRVDNNANYALTTNMLRKHGSYDATAKKIFCYARSNDNSGALKFYHLDSQFKFKVSDPAYDAVTIVANGESGAKNSINPDITFMPGRIIDLEKEYSGSNLSYNPNSVTAGTHPYFTKGALQYTHNSGTTNGSSEINVTLSGNPDSEYYVAVPALYTYEQGVSFKLKSNSQVVKTLTAGQSITTAAAGIINFGDLGKIKPNNYSSYYDMWKDGVAFRIGQSLVDPKAEEYSGLNPVLIENTCNLSSITNWTNINNIYFVKAGAVLTIDSPKYWNDDPCTLIIVGDSPEAKSEVVWNKTLAPRGGAVALKNLNITSSIDNSIDSEGKLSRYMIIDGCRIVLPNGEFAKAVNGASSGWNKIELVNNDFIYTTGVNSKFARICPSAAYTFASLTVKNNQSYTKDGGLAHANSCLIWDYWQMRVSFQDVDFQNNTFVNAAYGYNVIYCANQGVAVGGNLTIKNNINYVDGPVTSYCKLVLLADANKTGVNISASGNYGWGTADLGKMQVWGNVSITPFSADPFASKDFTNGKFVLTSAAATVAADCGAKR